MYELKVVSRFAAAHQLKMVAEKCENLHGHNWRVELYIAGNELNNAGVLMDFGEIKIHLNDIIESLVPDNACDFVVASFEVREQFAHVFQ